MRPQAAPAAGERLDDCADPTDGPSLLSGLGRAGFVQVSAG
ncbi:MULTISPECIES: hypothetical protein [unclassified Nonomuraea]